MNKKKDSNKIIVPAKKIRNPFGVGKDMPKAGKHKPPNPKKEIPSYNDDLSI